VTRVLRRIARATFAAVMVLAIFAPGARAEGDAITVTAWRVTDGAFTVGDRDDVCASFTVPDINFEYGGGLVAECDYDGVLVRFSGVFTLDRETLMVVAHDDGSALLLNGN